MGSTTVTFLQSGGFNQQTESDLEATLIDAPRVLLAEDDAALRAGLAEILRKNGYWVIEAQDGAALMQYLALCEERLEFPDVVVTDITMPGFSGLEVLRDMRSAGWQTPFIFITAYGDPGIRAEADAMGAARVFDKPFEVDDLLIAVNLCTEPLDGRSKN